MGAMNNIILLTDSYKVSHHKQYPPGTEQVYSYFESRGGRWKDVVFFGLQYYLREYLHGVRVWRDEIDQAAEYFAKHFGNDKIFNREGWDYIVRNHIGALPVSIKAVPEVSVVPNYNVITTTE